MIRQKLQIISFIFILLFTHSYSQNKDLYSYGKYLHIGSTKQVFTDYFLVDAGYGVLSWNLKNARKPDNLPLYSSYGVKLVVSDVEISSPIINPSNEKYQKGEIVGGYTSLLKDGDTYKLWYEAYDEDFHNKRLCYAESKDGINWIKPNLGIVSFEGSTDNNIVITDVGLEGNVFIDPIAPKSEKFKYIYVGGGLKKNEIQEVGLEGDPAATEITTLKAMVSPDGLHWKKLDRILMTYKLDTQNICFYDPFENTYVAYVRGMLPYRTRGIGARRIVSRATSKDFNKFSTPVVVLRPEIYDSFDTDIYTNAAQLLPEAGQVYIAMPAFFHRTSDDVDLMLYTSRDGTFWQRVTKKPFVSINKRGILDNYQIYAGYGIVPFEKDKWIFPLSVRYAGHNTDFLYSKEDWEKWGGIKLGIVRRDGFTAIEAESKGEFYTLPLIFKGKQLKVNVTGGYGGRIRVGIWDANNHKPIPGYEIDNCDGIRTEAFYKPLSWNGNSDLSELEGKPVRLRIELIRMRIHSFQFTD